MKLARIKLWLTLALLISFSLAFQIVDEASQEVLVEKPDRVQAVKESEIEEDENHNVNSEIEDDMSEPEEDGPVTGVTIDFGMGGITSNIGVEVEFEEDFYDPETDTFTQKVVKEGPGYQTVTIVSQQGGMGGGDAMIFEEIIEEIFNAEDQAQGDNAQGGQAVQGMQMQGGQNQGMMGGMFSQMAQLMGMMQQQQAMAMNDIVKQSINKLSQGPSVRPPRKNHFLNFDEEEEETPENQPQENQEAQEEEVVQEEQVKQEEVKTTQDESRKANNKFEVFEDEAAKQKRKDEDRHLYRNLLWTGGMLIMLIQVVGFVLYCRSKADEKRKKDRDLFSMNEEDANEPIEEIRVDAEFHTNGPTEQKRKNKGKRD